VCRKVLSESKLTQEIQCVQCDRGRGLSDFDPSSGQTNIAVVQDIEQLGVVTTRSSILIVIDTGYLNLWSHNRRPVMPDDVLSTVEATVQANSSVDLHIVGSDAERAGRLLNMSWHPLYVYDQPLDHVDLSNKLDAIARKNQLDARFEVIPERVPHRKRVAFAIEQGRGAGEANFTESGLLQ
jgi:hypothetical protein